jgi:hypothetical protein
VILNLVACSSVQVTTDYDTSRQFKTLNTYAWVEPNKKLIIDPLVDNDLMNNRVQRSLELALAAQGFVKAEGDKGADFFITYHVSSETKLSVSSFHGNYGYYPCWGNCYNRGRDISVRQYKQGTFMLDIIDPATTELIWRGVAGRRLSSGTPQERDAYVREMVSAILAAFPPMPESPSI